MRGHSVRPVAAKNDPERLAELERVRMDHPERVADSIPWTRRWMDVLSRVAVDAFDFHRVACHGFSDEATLVCFLQWVL